MSSKPNQTLLRVCLVLCILLVSFFPKVSFSNEAEAVEIENRIENILKGMSLKEKVGQLLMVGFGGQEITNESRLWIKERHVGGVILFSRNIKDHRQVTRFNNNMQKLVPENKIPIFIGLDQEGGNVLRIKEGIMLLPGNMTMGATNSELLALASGSALGNDLKRLGFNMNLAPVLDVNSNPKNPVIGIRSYGESPSKVSKLGAAFVLGQQSSGVSSVAKHFPGHGDTKSDSHFSMPIIDADISRLTSVELAPFQKSFNHGLDAVMTAHIALPQITGDPELPATLSEEILTKVLRKQLGFEGIVLTDGLEMQGIVQKYGSGKAALLAIKAGADMPMILWTRKAKEEVYKTLMTAVNSGEISMERLNTSVRRILRVKIRRGLLSHVNSLDWSPEALFSHQKVSSQISKRGITLLNDSNALIPFDESKKRILVIGPSGDLISRLKKDKRVKSIKIPTNLNSSKRQEYLGLVSNYAGRADLIVMIMANKGHSSFVKMVKNKYTSTPMIGVSIASPYLGLNINGLDAYMCTFSYLKEPQKAAADILVGALRGQGIPPVKVQ